LCREVNDKETLLAIFNSGLPLNSRIIEPIESLPPNHMCHGIHVAMRHNWIELVRKYRDACDYSDRILEELAKKGAHVTYSKEQFHKTFEHDPHYFADMFDFAANNGDLEILQHNLTGVYGSHMAMNDAARNGHYEIVRWLHEEQRMRNSRGEVMNCTENAMEFAVRGNPVERQGNAFDIFQYLFDRCRTRSRVLRVEREAIALQRDNILEYIRRHGQSLPLPIAARRVSLRRPLQISVRQPLPVAARERLPIAAFKTPTNKGIVKYVKNSDTYF
jgi:hypothetical protein